jgi:hypothetical protein
MLINNINSKCNNINLILIINKILILYSKIYNNKQGNKKLINNKINNKSFNYKMIDMIKLFPIMIKVKLIN